MAEAAGPQSSMADWLALHEVGAPQMHSLLETGGAAPTTAPATGARVQPEATGHITGRIPEDIAAGFSAGDLWQGVARAALRHWPDLAPRISETLQTVTCHFHLDPAKYKRAFTLHAGAIPHTGVLVGMTYRGDPRSMLTMAHEFGHALQLTVLQGRPAPPPILREACAYLAEAALVEMAQNAPEALVPGTPVSPALAHSLQTLWQEDSTKLHKRAARRLVPLLKQPHSAYEYGWNYPPARALMHRLIRPDAPPALACNLLQGGVTLPGILAG